MVLDDDLDVCSSSTMETPSSSMAIAMVLDAILIFAIELDGDLGG